MSRILTLGLLVSSILVAHYPSSQEGDEQRIMALENIWNQTQLKHDADAMRSMLHPNFAFTDYDGTVMSRAQFLVSIRDPTNKFEPGSFR